MFKLTVIFLLLVAIFSVYGRGGIHDIGDVFQQALQKKGIEAIHTEEMHLPHDRDAYLRARQTVLELMKEQPDAIFDIHRDAAPPEQYIGELDRNFYGNAAY